MIRSSAFLAFLVQALVAQQSSDTAVGVFPFLVGNMDPQVQKVVDDTVANNLDTLYVSVFRATGPQTGDLWITDSAGKWNSAWGPVRPGGAGINLVSLIQAAHAKNLRVVGVLKCFSDNVQPTHAGHRAYLLDVIGYLTGTYHANGAPVYDLDGLALDYIRFVGSGTGNDPTLVTNFLRDVRAKIGSLSLHAYLIANRYTFDGPGYTLNFRSYNQVIADLSSQFGQHWEQMARWIDVMMPMTYTADGSIYNQYNEHLAYVKQATLYCRQACNRASYPTRRVQPVIKTYNDSETTTPQTIDACINGAFQGGADGYQAFRYGTLSPQPTWWAKLKQYATPGQNLPVPIVAVQLQGLGGRFDPTQSRDGDEPSTNLMVRFDWGNDATIDTGWLPNQQLDHVLRKPGGWPFAMQVKDSQGHVSTTTRAPIAADVLTLSRTVWFSTLAGSLPMTLDAGPQTAGSTYLVLASFAGILPGTPWQPGFVVPLNLDSLTVGMFSAVNTPILLNGLGQLDAQGRATAVFSVPSGALNAFTFQSIYWAAVAVEAGGNPLFVSNGTAMLILP
jgi:hypothetical protein